MIMQCSPSVIGRSGPGVVTSSSRVMTHGLRSRIPLLVGAGMLLAFGVFGAPFGLPPSSSTKSASALLGFNNTLAYTLYVPLLAATVWVFSSLVRWPEHGVFAVPSQLLPVPSAWVWGVLAAHTTVFFLLYSFKGQFVFSEALYFQHTAFRVLSGDIPYTGFSFLYGPATVYPQAVLAHVISPTAAYAVYYVGVYLLGLYALYVALVWLGFDGHRADFIFVVLAIGFFNPMTGLNYTPLRQLLPMLAVVAAWSYLVRGTSKWLTVGSLIVWLAIMYSPDMGAAALAGVLLMGGVWYGATPLFRWRPPDSAPGIVGFLALPALAAALTMAAFVATAQPVSSLAEYIGIVTRLAGGGSNTPVQPSLPLASLVAVTVAAGGAAVAAVRARGLIEDSILLAVLVVTLVILQRAAFAKPDSFHLAFAGLPMLLVGLKLFAIDTKKIIPVPLILALIGLILPLQYYDAAAIWPAVASRWSDRGTTPATRRQAPIPDQLQALVSHMGSETPYYMHNLTYYSLPVYIRNRLHYALYFTTPEEAFTDDDIRRVIHTLAEHDNVVIVLRREFEGADQPTPTGSGLRRVVNMLAASPVSGSISYDATVAALKMLWNPFFGYLRRCYEIRAESADLMGLARITARESCRGTEPGG